MRSGAAVQDFARAALRSHRRRLGHSRSDLALLVHTSPQTVAQWETGVTTPTPPHLKALADCLNLMTDDLLTTTRTEATLRGLRERCGFTARAAAAAVGVSASVLSTVETGSGALTDTIAKRMAGAYGIPADELHSAWQRTVDDRTRRLTSR